MPTSVTLERQMSNYNSGKKSSDEDIVKVVSSKCGQFVATVNASGQVDVYDMNKVSIFM